MFEFCDKNGRCPTKKEQYKECNVWQWLQHQKTKINNSSNEIYKLLSTNNYVKCNLDAYIQKLESNPNKIIRTFDKSKELLFEFCEENGRCPAFKEQYKECNVRQWLQDQKKKINNISDEIYKLLSTNTHIKCNLDEYIQKLESNPNKITRTFDESKTLMFEFCEKHGRCPIFKEQYKECNIGMWLHTQKQKINNSSDETYKELSTNKYVKLNLDAYIQKLEANPDKIMRTFDKSKELLFEFCDENGRCPTKKEQYKECNIGQWLQTQKAKINNSSDETYKELSTNNHVKCNLDKYIQNKALRK